MTNFVQLMSAISAFGAAALWLYASRIKTPESFPISIPSMHIYSDTVVGSQVGGSTNGSTAELDALAFHPYADNSSPLSQRMPMDPFTNV